MIVWSQTSFHAALIQEIAFNISTSWIISEAFLLSSIREMTHFKSLFRYLTLKFLIIPASRGCSLDVVFLGKKTTLIFEYETTKFSRWQGALCIKNKMFLLAAAIFRLILVNTESINFACHPWFLTWIVMHVIRTFRVDQVSEISRFSTSLNNDWFNNFLCRNNYEKSNS